MFPRLEEGSHAHDWETILILGESKLSQLAALICAFDEGEESEDKEDLDVSTDVSTAMVMSPLCFAFSLKSEPDPKGGGKLTKKQSITATYSSSCASY